MRELAPLFERHWRELALNQDTIPLRPDWDRYLALELSGNLIITTARSGGVLAGYIFNLVSTHLHYATTLHAQIDMFWLDPVYRGGTFALKWLRANERSLSEHGVKRISVAVKNHYASGRVGNLFRRMGYLPIETVWSRTWVS